MKKIILIFYFVLIATAGYSHFHSHPYHHTYHPIHKSNTYHSHSYGHGGYSKPRVNYYSYPVHYFPSTHHYYNHYHHFHVGDQKDTVFCADANHSEPATSLDNAQSYGGLWFLFIVVFVIVVIIIFMAAVND